MKRWGALGARALRLVALLAISGELCCTEHSAGEVRLQLGTGSGETIHFDLTTALADYVALEDGSQELRLTLSNYRGIECQGFLPPKPGQYLITVTVFAPRGEALERGKYPFAYASDTAPSVLARQATPAVRTPQGNHPLQPGGYLALTELELASYGSVTGLLAFEFSGDGQHPATAIEGRFTARLCRYEPASLAMGERTP